jgi:hypothetical protein
MSLHKATADPERWEAQLKKWATKNRNYRKQRRKTSPEFVKHTAQECTKYTLKKQEKLAGRPKPKYCEICGHDRRLSWDHDHETKLFRGWICQRCNAALGMTRDSVEILKKLIAYLEQSRHV